jgi:hypothetical protein
MAEAISENFGGRKSMKKKIVAVIVFTCLMVVSLTTFALSHVQVAESAKIQNEKTADPDSQLPNSQGATQHARTFESANPQTFKSDNQQASSPEAAENSGKVDDSCKDQPALSKNGDSLETDQSQTDGTNTSPPDGRIYSDAGPPYPYIPTCTPKGPLGIPAVPFVPKD